MRAGMVRVGGSGWGSWVGVGQGLAVAGFTAVSLTRVRAACPTKYRPDRSRRVSPSSPCTSGETWGSTSRATASGAWGSACLWLSCRTGGLNWCTGFLLTHRMRGSSQQRAARGEASKTQCRCRQMYAKHADGAGASALTRLSREWCRRRCRKRPCRAQAHPRVLCSSACICVESFLLSCVPHRRHAGEARWGVGAWRCASGCRRPCLVLGAWSPPRLDAARRAASKVQPPMHTDGPGPLWPFTAEHPRPALVCRANAITTVPSVCIGVDQWLHLLAASRAGTGRPGEAPRTTAFPSPSGPQLAPMKPFARAHARQPTCSSWIRRLVVWFPGFRVS